VGGRGPLRREGTHQGLSHACDRFKAILSGALLLDHLADRHDDPAPRAAARRIEAAVQAALEAGEAQTADVGGRSSTRDAARAVLRRVGQWVVASG